MGVPGLYSFLYRFYPRAFVTKRPSIDKLYIDANAVLYRIAEETHDAEEIGRKIVDLVHRYEEAYGCRVYVYMDGSAPMAKVRRRRMRRFMYPPPKAETQIPGEPGDRLYSEVPHIGEWTPAYFSPGTRMMEDIHQILEKEMRRYTEEDISRSPHSRYSSYHEEGEGEHKIMRDIRRDGTPGDRVGIMGKDADLILLGMNEGLHIIRHTDIGYGPEDPMVHIDCGSLFRMIQEENHRTIHEGSKSVYSGVSSGISSPWDIVIASTLIGNDFLPPVPETYDVHKVMPIIIKKCRKMWDPVTSTIDWDEVYSMVDDISGEISTSDWVGRVRSHEGFCSLYYSAYHPYELDREGLVQEWANGVEWVLTYYTGGVDITTPIWQYPLTIAPCIYDLRTYRKRGQDMRGREPYPSSGRVLAAILPRWLHMLTDRNPADRYPQYYPYTFRVTKPTDIPVIPNIPYEVVTSL